MSATSTAAVLVLRDLITAGALLWLTVSDSWAAIGVLTALVLTRARVVWAGSSPGIHTREGTSAWRGATE